MLIGKASTLVGITEIVAAAKAIVEARVEELENIVEDLMTVNPKHHRQLVARRREVLRRIGDEEASNGGGTINEEASDGEETINKEALNEEETIKKKHRAGQKR